MRSLLPWWFVVSACAPATTPEAPAPPPPPPPVVAEPWCSNGIGVALPSQDICLGLTPLTWLDAATHCEQHGSHLMRIDSPAENQAIAEALRPRRANVQAWIDLSDREQEGSWRTSVDETQVYAWLDGEPNDFGGGEDCVELLLPDGRWNDVDCGAARMPLCERSAAIRAAE